MPIRRTHCLGPLRDIDHFAGTCLDDVRSAWRDYVTGDPAPGGWARLCEEHFFDVRLVNWPMRVRTRLVAELTHEGLSTRAIGAALGSADQTVRADQKRAGMSPRYIVTGLDGVDPLGDTHAS